MTPKWVMTSRLRSTGPCVIQWHSTEEGIVLGEQSFGMVLQRTEWAKHWYIFGGFQEGEGNIGMTGMPNKQQKKKINMTGKEWKLVR